MTFAPDHPIQTTVTMHDDGILAALRRISVFDGTKGEEKTVGKYGGTVFQLQPGDYELLIRDRLFGWGGRIETVTIGDDGPGFDELHIRRDLARKVAARRYWDSDGVPVGWAGV